MKITYDICFWAWILLSACSQEMSTTTERDDIVDTGLDDAMTRDVERHRQCDGHVDGLG